MKKMPYDDLPLIPSVVARRVAEMPYTGKEMSGGMPHGFVAKVERLRALMTEADIRDFMRETDERCRAAYESEEENFFHKISRSKTNRGRDQLYVWATHWLASFLAQKHGFRA